MKTIKVSGRGVHEIEIMIMNESKEFFIISDSLNNNDESCYYEILDTISQEKIRISIRRVYLELMRHWIISPMYSSEEDNIYPPDKKYRQASWNYYYKYGDLMIECPDGVILRKLYQNNN